MKILIMGFTKIKYMPYLKSYTENIDEISNEVHLLYWNRDLKEEDTSSFEGYTRHEFRCYQEDDVSKFTKLGSFIKFRKFATKILKNEKFDRIFILHSLTGVLIADELKKNYQSKYVFDYRDSTYESFPMFKKIVGDLVKGSYATFVSSDAFRIFLPKSQEYKIHTSHNILIDSLDHKDEKEKNGILSDKIRIAFWGFIRHEAINREIIKKIASDSRFELHYYGRMQKIALSLKKYTEELEAKNIFFHGEYKPKDRYEFVRKTDIIHNIYMDKNTMLAMGNKYYDGIIFGIPQLCMNGSFMGERVERCEVGIVVNPNRSSFLEEINNYYLNIEWNQFRKKCNEETLRVSFEYNKGIILVKKFLESSLGNLS